ncbi:MAG: DJ-1/PfpI family protein [Thermoleophilia bacterium]
MANVLMVIAPERFRDEEVAETREVLTELGHDVELASTRTGRATGVRGSAVDVCHRLADVHGDAWDGVVFTGGPGMQALWDDPDAMRVAREAKEHGRVVGAICTGPVVLAGAGLLTGREATVWHLERSRLAAAGALASPLHVVVDGRLVTADGPRQSHRFGVAVAAALAEPGELVTPGAEVPEIWVG